MYSLYFQNELITGRLSSRDTKRYFSLFGWFALVYYLTTTVTQTVILVVTLYFFPSVGKSWLFPELLSFITNYCIALPLSFLLLLRRLPWEEPTPRKMSNGDYFGGFCVCITLMMGGNYVSSIFMTVIESYLGSAPENPVESSVTSVPLWATLIFTVLAAPILEELVFRRLICRRLLPLGEGWAILLSSAFFALFHGNFYQVFYAFTLGCLFSFIYLKTGKLIYTVAFHIAINFVGSFISAIIYPRVDGVVPIELLSKLAKAIAAVNLSLLSANDAWNLFWLGAYWLFTLTLLATATAGVLFLIVNRHKLRVNKGTLPPHEDATLKLLTSSGIIACIIVFSIVLTASALPS